MSGEGLSNAARLACGGVLMALLVFGIRGDVPPGEAVAVHHASTSTILARRIAESTAPLAYRDSIPPSRAISTLLASAATEGRTVEFEVPDAPPRLVAYAPLAPIAQRRAALIVRLRGEARESVRLTIEDGTGHADTISVSIGPDGVTETRVAVEPARSGLERWTLSTDSDTTTTTAWVRPAEEARVLVLTGPPDWESRYLVRALESSGLDVEVRQELGRGLVIGSDAATGSVLSPDELSRFDVVVLASSVREGRQVPLERWVVEQGGGLLLLEGRASGEGGLHAGRTTPLTWSGPAELVPLPPLDLATIDAALAPAVDLSELPVVSAGSDVVVAASSRGRGRVLRSALATWPWVLAGDAERAHAEWWVSAIEWLAGGLADDAILSERPAQTRTAWVGRIDGRVSERARIASAAGEASLSVSSVAPDRGLVSFVPTSPGAHPILNDDGTPLGAATVLAGTERLTWADAALEIGGHGGRIVGRGASALQAQPLDEGSSRAALLFALLATLMGAGWLTRRIHGLT